MKSPSIHDGERVKARCKELKVLGKVFADEMAWTPRKLYRMFQQSDWPTGDLQRAGQILGCDFFAAYSGVVAQRQDGFLIGLIVMPGVLLSDIARKRALEELQNHTEEE